MTSEEALKTAIAMKLSLELGKEIPMPKQSIKMDNEEA